jgi:hypothetical protein
MQPQQGQKNPHAGSKREDVDIEQIIERSGCFEASAVLCELYNHAASYAFVWPCSARRVAIALMSSKHVSCFSTHTQIYAALEECLGEHSRDWRKCQVDINILVLAFIISRKCQARQLSLSAREGQLHLSCPSARISVLIEYYAVMLLLYHRKRWLLLRTATRSTARSSSHK